MARCLVSERLGRRVFYGAMITEGAVALVWAMAASYFFYGGGWQTLDPDMSEAFRSQFAADGGKTLIQYYPAPVVAIRPYRCPHVWLPHSCSRRRDTL